MIENVIFKNVSSTLLNDSGLTDVTNLMEFLSTEISHRANSLMAVEFTFKPDL